MPLDTWNVVRKVIFLCVLVFVLLMILTWTNLVKCNQLGNGWCDVYWGIMGKPKILIAYGYDGLGNAAKLETILENRDILALNVIKRDIKYLTSGTLSRYDLVIVTQARTMTPEELEMFYDYVIDGGKLVWTGDAGTGTSSNEKTPKQLYEEQYKELTVDNAITPEEEAILRESANNVGVTLNENNLTVSGDTSSWVRITKNGRIIKFNEDILSAEYIDNFCHISNCTTRRDFVGHLNHNEDSVISFRMPQKSPMSGDFAVVDVINNTTTKVDLFLDTRSVIIAKDGKIDYGRTDYPIIILSKIGEKVIYSAVPLENFVDVTNPPLYEQINTGMFYATILEQIYENMIRGTRT